MLNLLKKMKGIYEMWNNNDKSHEPDIDTIVKYINPFMEQIL